MKMIDQPWWIIDGRGNRLAKMPTCGKVADADTGSLRSVADWIQSLPVRRPGQGTWLPGMSA